MNSINTMDSLTIKKNPQEIENYNYLLLSIYFYLKHNNYNSTADILFSEGNLENIFKFPQDIKEISNESDKLLKNFIQYLKIITKIINLFFLEILNLKIFVQDLKIILILKKKLTKMKKFI